MSPELDTVYSTTSGGHAESWNKTGAVIYLDTSVALAHLLVEDHAPPARLWQEDLISSRLLEYEVWTRIHARKLTHSHSEEVRSLLGRVALVELSSAVLARASESFPKPVRTLGRATFASIDFLRQQGQSVILASYDSRLADAARALRIARYKL